MEIYIKAGFLESYQKLRLLVFLTVIFLHGVSRCASVKYLGCYADQSGSARDLNGQAMVLPGISVALCTSLCQINGFPYAGLQLTQQCFCGASYGKYSASLKCNSTCSAMFCGGYMANDVYYSVDSSYSSQRSVVLHTNATTYQSARSQCVSANGDLLRVDTRSIIDTMVQAISNATKISPKNNIIAAFIGLAMQTTTGLTWSDLNGASYLSEAEAVSGFWDPDDTKAGPCIQYNATTQRLQSVSCTLQLPFFCSQIPPAEVDAVNSNGTVATTDQSSTISSTNRLALYIVLPIFFCCYGGSCIIYCVHKVYMSCAKHQITASLMQNTEEQEKTAMPPSYFPFPDKPIFSQAYEESSAKKMYAEYIPEPALKQPATYELPSKYPDAADTKRQAIGRLADNQATNGFASAASRSNQAPPPPPHSDTPRINLLSNSTANLLDDDQLGATGGNDLRQQSIGEILKQKVARKTGSAGSQQ